MLVLHAVAVSGRDAGRIPYDPMTMSMDTYKTHLDKLDFSVDGMQMDHIVPHKSGGAYHPYNLMPSPAKFNNLKNDAFSLSHCQSYGILVCARALAASAKLGNTEYTEGLDGLRRTIARMQSEGAVAANTRGADQFVNDLKARAIEVFSKPLPTAADVLKDPEYVGSLKGMQAKLKEVDKVTSVLCANSEECLSKIAKKATAYEGNQKLHQAAVDMVMSKTEEEVASFILKAENMDKLEQAIKLAGGGIGLGAAIGGGTAEAAERFAEEGESFFSLLMTIVAVGGPCAYCALASKRDKANAQLKRHGLHVSQGGRYEAVIDKKTRGLAMHDRETNLFQPFSSQD